MTSARKVLTGWGRSTASGADVVRISSTASIEHALKHPLPRGTIGRGLGRSYGDQAQNAGGTVLDCTPHRNIHVFDSETGVVGADSGLSLHDLMTVVVPAGWFPHVTPGTRHVTLGGAIAADVHGKNHHRDGTFSAGVRSIRLVTPTGAADISATCQPEVYWATVGGMGLTGLIDRVELQLQPIPSAWLEVRTLRTPNLEALIAEMLAHDQEHRFSVAWIDLLATGGSLGRSVLTQGDWAPPDKIPPLHRKDPLAFDARPLLKAPPWAPSGMLNRWTVAAFNEGWYRKAPTKPRTTNESIAAFFHPLDAVEGWNRIYGRRGFLQYQFAVPDTEVDSLRAAIERISDARAGCLLAVLKRFGPAGEGHLSFPMAGWTLALDVPVRTSGCMQLIDDLDRIVINAGGRVYLAKDATLPAKRLPAMYPRLDEWRSIQHELDPYGTLRSDLDRRLNLTGWDH